MIALEINELLSLLEDLFLHPLWSIQNVLNGQ
jgi:hypothetical protein